MGGVGKSGISGSMRKTSGISTEGSSDKFIPVKNGVKISQARVHKSVNTSRVSGSRFDVLCDEDTNLSNETIQEVSKDTGNVIQKGKTVLTEITNCAGTHSKLGTKFTPQSSKNNRKKGSGVATTSRYVVKLNENCQVSSSVNGPLTTSSSMEAVDVEDLDSASVLRHLHQEVNNFVPQPVDNCSSALCTPPPTKFVRMIGLCGLGAKHVFAAATTRWWWLKRRLPGGRDGGGGCSLVCSGGTWSVVAAAWLAVEQWSGGGCNNGRSGCLGCWQSWVVEEKGSGDRRSRWWWLKRRLPGGRDGVVVAAAWCVAVEQWSVVAAAWCWRWNNGVVVAATMEDLGCVWVVGSHGWGGEGLR
ncbi:hypothetical protein LWI29_036894 [Acer saccharum]|uniref:Uncharacterized protein n=1 Tax=Acer saccharum TaxID=4024 RepID=A0AA39T154_ACESA|nr:hypothetical protein LWI29_036894 [Acer saccharum]